MHHAHLVAGMRSLPSPIRLSPRHRRPPALRALPPLAAGAADGVPGEQFQRAHPGAPVGRYRLVLWLREAGGLRQGGSAAGGRGWVGGLGWAGIEQGGNGFDLNLVKVFPSGQPWTSEEGIGLTSSSFKFCILKASIKPFFFRFCVPGRAGRSDAPLACSATQPFNPRTLPHPPHPAPTHPSQYLDLAKEAGLTLPGIIKAANVSAGGGEGWFHGGLGCSSLRAASAGGHAPAGTPACGL